MDIPNFYDRVYACWMGKNIGGTLGGPLEGRMELLDIKGYTQAFVEPMENDDLDLQLVNLHCVEEYGGRADMRLLRREWLEHVHFQFDEYGHALTNMRRGIGAPLCGWYNNFFTDCMGSPIRSEIWAVLCAGMPDLAAYYAYHDASVDHAGGEGVYGEVFFAVLQSLAFVESAPHKLIDAALSYLPGTSQVRLAVEHLLACHARGLPWQQARQALIDRFAGENFTYAPLNIAFTLMGWLYAEGFTDQMLTTLNCGYDTDCTVATLGSLLGILHGTPYLDARWTQPLGERIVVSRPINGFDAPGTITELTARTIAARGLVQAHYDRQADKAAYAIPYQHDVAVYTMPEAAHKAGDLDVVLRFSDGTPAFAPGQRKQLAVTLHNRQDVDMTYAVTADVPGFAASEASVLLPARGSAVATLALTAPVDKAASWAGRLVLRRTLGSTYWNTDCLPLVLLPTMDWRVTADGEARSVYCDTNRLRGDAIAGPDTKTLTAHTVLRVPGDTDAWLKFACKNPLTVTLDGEVIIRCGEETAVIPAYHRADLRKCAQVHLSAGAHTLAVEVGAPASLEDLYFMIVDPQMYWAYVIEAVFALPGDGVSV